MNSPQQVVAIREEVAAEIRRDITQRIRQIVRQHKDHDLARSEALGLAIQNGDFDPASYTHSIHYPPTFFVAPCGCRASKEKQCDGDSVWAEWVWSDVNCEDES